MMSLISTFALIKAYWQGFSRAVLYQAGIAILQIADLNGVAGRKRQNRVQAYR
jgi:hypothetical protein